MANPAHVRKHDSGSVGFNLGVIALGLAMLGVGLAYIIDSASQARRFSPHRFDDETTLTRTLGGKELAIPLSWFRYAEQRIDGFAKQIDLQLVLPLGLENKPERVDVTLLPRSRVRPSSSLLDGVYLHQFMPTEISGPPGLVGKPLYPSGGFENETVWYDALSAEPFVAKCSTSVAEAGPRQCLRTVYLGPGVAAIYAFDESALAGWRRFDTEIDARLRQIGAL